MPPPQPLSKGAGRRSSGHPREGLAGTPLGCSELRLPEPFGKGWGGGGIGPPGIPEHYPQRRLDRDPGTGSPVWIPLARTKTVSWLHKTLKIQRFPTEIRPDHDITFPKCKHYFLCADEDRCLTENAENIRFSWRGRETVSWLKRHAQPSEFPPGFTSWRRGCCQGRTHKILKTHKVSGPCWNCPPGGALKTHKILKTHKVSGRPEGNFPTCFS